MPIKKDGYFEGKIDGKGRGVCIEGREIRKIDAKESRQWKSERG
jgi:hypothetical protein